MAMNSSHIPTADDYRSFINALLGLEDEAQLSGFCEHGTKLLREAIAAFDADVKERFPR